MEDSPDNNLPRIMIRNDNGDVEEGQEMEDGEVNRDPTCSEGVLKCRITSLSEIDIKLLSPPIYIRDLPW